jgi:DNA-binding beta-propeller fold protein YncE
MTRLRIWSLITALTTSAGLLLGTGTNWQAIVCDFGTSEVYPVDLPLQQPPTAESPLTSIGSASFVAITPEATRALVTGGLNSPATNIFGLNLTTTPISIAVTQSLLASLTTVALTPDGAKTYALDIANNVQVLNTSDLSTVATILSSAFSPFSLYAIALSPDRAEGYITTRSTKVFVIDTTTNTVKLTSYDLPAGTESNLIAVTPDGSEIYVSDLGSNIIYYVTLNDGVVHAITGASGASASEGVAIAPDGTSAYVVQTGTGVSVLTKIDIATHTVVAEFVIPTQLTFPSSVAITPDGKTACIADTGSLRFALPGQYLAFLDTTTGASSTLQLSTATLSSLLGVAITPDQAPTARFRVSARGLTVHFNASSSSSPVGTIATYAWNFGDGQTATTSSPTISHTYSAKGTFTVTLTVTNTAGTSTALTFTGQTASNHGGPSAIKSRNVTVLPLGVTKFKGKVHRNHKEKKVFLKTKWTKSRISHTTRYEIFSRNQKIAILKAKHHRRETIRLHPEHFPHSISKDYRHYLDHKYSIQAVDSSGQVSQRTFVHVAKH